MTVAAVSCLRRTAWRLAKAMAPDLAAKATTARETDALDKLLSTTGPRLRVDWVDIAFNSKYGGRFKPPETYGVLYAALTLPAACSEAAFNWARTFNSTSAGYPSGTRLVLQILQLKLTGTFMDVRKGHKALQDPDSRTASQAFGFRAQAQGWDGIAYRSVRARPRGTCVVVFRKTALVACVETGQIILNWDGAKFGLQPQPAIGHG